MTRKECVTNGMERCDAESGPWTVRKIEGGGRIVWDESRESLLETLAEDTSWRLLTSVADASDIPRNGLRYIAGREIWDEIVSESGIGTEKAPGYIAINDKAFFLAAWSDNDYWPNTDRGGH